MCDLNENPNRMDIPKRKCCLK